MKSGEESGSYRQFSYSDELDALQQSRFPALRRTARRKQQRAPFKRLSRCSASLKENAKKTQRVVNSIYVLGLMNT